MREERNIRIESERARAGERARGRPTKTYAKEFIFSSARALFLSHRIACTLPSIKNDNDAAAARARSFPTFAEGTRRDVTREN